MRITRSSHDERRFLVNISVKDAAPGVTLGDIASIRFVDQKPIPVPMIHISAYVNAHVVEAIIEAAYCLASGGNAYRATGVARKSLRISKRRL